MVLPKTGFMPEMELEWKIPQWSNAIERQRARTYHQAYSALVGLYNLEQALKEVRAGRTKSWNDFTVPESAVSVGFHEAARGVLSHHMVIREGKIANYQPYPPTPWNGNPRDVPRDAGPLRGRGAEHADLRGERAGRTSRGSTSCARSTRSTRACPAACTCTARARSARSSTRRRGCAEPADGGRRLRCADRARPGADRAARGGPGPPGPRGRGRAGRVGHAALRRGAGADLRRVADGARRRSASGLDGGRRGRQPDADPRPLPGRPRDPRARGARRACGPYMESHGGDVELVGVEDGVARIAARRALQGLPRVGGDAGAGDQDARSRRPRPISRGWRSRACASRPPGSSCPSCSPARRCRWRTATAPAPPPAWTEIETDVPAAGRDRADDGRPAPTCSSRTSAARCWRTATRAASAARGSTARR